MRDEKVETAREVLLDYGFDVAEAVIVEMLDKIQGKPRKSYEVNDFVAFYQGMGEMDHGTVIKVIGNGTEDHRYRIRPYRKDGDAGYETVSTLGDMRGLSTPAEADEYERIRSGGK